MPSLHEPSMFLNQQDLSWSGRTPFSKSGRVVHSQHRDQEFDFYALGDSASITQSIHHTYIDRWLRASKVQASCRCMFMSMYQILPRRDYDAKTSSISESSYPLIPQPSIAMDLALRKQRVLYLRTFVLCDTN